MIHAPVALSLMTPDATRRMKTAIILTIIQLKCIQWRACSSCRRRSRWTLVMQLHMLSPICTVTSKAHMAVFSRLESSRLRTRQITSSHRTAPVAQFLWNLPLQATTCCSRSRINSRVWRPPRWSTAGTQAALKAILMDRSTRSRPRASVNPSMRRSWRKMATMKHLNYRVPFCDRSAIPTNNLQDQRRATGRISLVISNKAVDSNRRTSVVIKSPIRVDRGALGTQMSQVVIETTKTIKSNPLLTNRQ